ncbi:MAG TPA: hypothetical protein VHY84_08175 [Bryobacteraceae bacterium]|jgi:hypothetical protein|nr:hypothetical protein [Bryobacteraceae bacterium]
MRLHLKILTAACFVPLCLGQLCFGQRPAEPGRGPARGGGRAGRPALFFSEEWKPAAKPAEASVNPAEAVSNPNLELKLYGVDGKNIQLTGAPGNESNPLHLWTGLCEQVCAAALRDKDNYVDLTGLAMIRWVTKTSGFHQVHPILKLADGTWLVGDHADGSTADWHQDEFSIADVRWMKLNIAKVVTTGNWVNNPDLSKVDEVGFTDLLPGSGHGPGGWSDVGKIEVFGKPVKR